MKTAIIGTGGVGGYFGATLAKAGNDVTFLARGEHLQAMLKKGLTVKSILGDFTIENIKATDRISEMGRPDLIIIAVKTYHLKDVREEISRIMHSDSVILPLQNGIFAVDELSEVIDRQKILGGLCRIISKIESPGVINHSGVTPAIVFGENDKSKTERIGKIHELFSAAGINCKISDDIEAELWKKFISICVSGLLAVSRTTYGELRELKETRQLMTELINEIYLISQKAGVNIEPGFVEKTISFIDTFPYDSTSSLTRDVLEMRPSEIDYQNGAVVKLGEKYRVATPVNRFVYNCILPGELRARGK